MDSPFLTILARSALLLLQKGNKMERVRLAVIGAGLIGAKHAELIRANPSCCLAGICDLAPARQATADKLGVPFYQRIEDILDRERPAGAIIATPNAAHSAAAELCARHSVHMLVEKPIAETLEEAHRIVKAAETHGVRVLVGHHRRHSPLTREARELVRGGTLGRLVGVSALWALLKPDDYFQVGWRRVRPGGGPALINLIHDLDSLRFICGEIREVYARTSSAVRGFEVEDSVSVTLSFENGPLGTILASDATAAPWSYEATARENPMYFSTDESCYRFLGTQASLAFPTMDLWRYADPLRRGWQHPMEHARRKVIAADPLALQLEHFCRVVRGEEPPIVDGLDGTRSLAAVLAVLESARTGKRVDLAPGDYR